VIGPVLAPLGTVAVSDEVLAAVMVAVTPLNFTTSSAAVALKPEPLIVTLVPTGPIEGVKPVMVGFNARSYVPEAVTAGPPCTDTESE